MTRRAQAWARRRLDGDGAGTDSLNSRG